MRRFILGTYRLALCVQGSYMLLLVGLSFFTMPIFALDGVLLRSLMIAFAGLGVALFLCRSRWQPAFIREPKGFFKGLGAMLASSFVFLVAMFLGYLAVINMNLEEPMSRNIAILTALPSLVVTGVMWWAALFLSFLPADDDTPPRVTPKRPIASPDARALRLSRTQQG